MMRHIASGLLIAQFMPNNCDTAYRRLVSMQGVVMPKVVLAKSGPIADYFCQPKVVLLERMSPAFQIMSWMPFHDSGSYIDSSGKQVYFECSEYISC